MIHLLAVKSAKTLYRSPSMRRLAWLSSAIVFTTLYLMWRGSGGHVLHFLTSSFYQKLSFDVICSPGLRYRQDAYGGTKCQPTGHRDDISAGALSPADILLQIITTGTILSDANDPQGTHDFAGLLSSIMMNGAPIMGVDDYVELSDFVNQKLGPVGRGHIMNYTAYADKFGNFIDVRKRELRVCPYNCWTERFLDYLYRHAAVARFVCLATMCTPGRPTSLPPVFPRRELKIVQYGSMQEAMVGAGTGDVWAVLEILGPTTGAGAGALGCALLADDGNNPTYRQAPPGTDGGTRRGRRRTQSTHDDVVAAGTGTLPPTDTADTAAAATDDDASAPPLTLAEMQALGPNGPSVTVRMSPSAIPDTRNFEWSPRKSFGSYRQQSGQLLYFLSGFLSLQVEVQNFLAAAGLGGPVIPTQAWGGSGRPLEGLLLGPNAVTKRVADALINAVTPTDVYDAVVNTTSAAARQGRRSLSTPLYHRAYPTHMYEQASFWHTMGRCVALST